MAKKRNKDTRVIFASYDRQHLRNILAQQREIDRIYDTLAQEAAAIGVATGFDDPVAPFLLSRFPQAKKRIDALIASTMGMIVNAIETGNKEEWLLSAQKNAKMIDALAAGTGIPRTTVEAWKQPNMDALAAFQKRKVNGMNLSQRVWNLTKQTKQELEMALDLGLGAGKSAADLSRDVRKYLNEPNKLFRRVRDKHGALHLSKRAEAYHPGMGVYRSSYKNALRLTATENNIAYRTSDHEKWNELDFVIGIHIQLSNNHTIVNAKGERVPFQDICDDMVGDYPKDFKFTGWHPFCRCFATPVLADWDEQLKRMKMEADGEDVSEWHYTGEITTTPEGYDLWMEDNKERIENATSKPYFIRDNPQYAEGKSE